MGGNLAEAHIVQMVDEPRQSPALLAWNDISIFLPADEVDELVVKMRRCSVEIAERLQGIGRGHGERCKKNLEVRRSGPVKSWTIADDQ